MTNRRLRFPPALWYARSASAADGIGWDLDFARQSRFQKIESRPAPVSLDAPVPCFALFCWSNP
jgi:hypothetical protein